MSSKSWIGERKRGRISRAQGREALARVAAADISALLPMSVGQGSLVTEDQIKVTSTEATKPKPVTCVGLDIQRSLTQVALRTSVAHTEVVSVNHSARFGPDNRRKLVSWCSALRSHQRHINRSAPGRLKSIQSGCYELLSFFQLLGGLADLPLAQVELTDRLGMGPVPMPCKPSRESTRLESTAQAK